MNTEEFETISTLQMNEKSEAPRVKKTPSDEALCRERPIPLKQAERHKRRGARNTAVLFIAALIGIIAVYNVSSNWESITGRSDIPNDPGSRAAQTPVAEEI
jgi:hypothetical protein